MQEGGGDEIGAGCLYTECLNIELSETISVMRTFLVDFFIPVHWEWTERGPLNTFFCNEWKQKDSFNHVNDNS